MHLCGRASNRGRLARAGPGVRQSKTASTKFPLSKRTLNQGVHEAGPHPGGTDEVRANQIGT
jgi:hypothetical protein